MDSPTTYHNPVLRDESIDLLLTDPAGTYADVTFGGGGHSAEVLRRLNKNGRLIAFDKDTDAVKQAAEFGKDDRLTLVNHDFVYMKNFLTYIQAVPVTGILADLGVSSHQFDTGERGFSFRYEARLDMRMDRRSFVDAPAVLNDYSPEHLQEVFGRYGELKNARTLAAEIVRRRSAAAIETVGDLVEAAEACMRRSDNRRKYLSQVFQAVRIEVNNELEGLKRFLQQSVEVLKPGGRLAVITYHSLEDRIVKNYFAKGKFFGNIEKDIYGRAETPFTVVNRKPVIPSDAEIERNPRARSAKLRVAEKNNDS